MPERIHTVTDVAGHTVLVVSAEDGSTLYVAGLALVRYIRTLERRLAEAPRA